MRRNWSIGRFAAVIGVVACFTGSDDAASAPGDFPYCAASRGDQQDYMNCGFATFEACLEELKGMRGYCAPNPYYVAAPPPAPPAAAPPVPAPSAVKPPRPRSRD